MTPTSMNRIWQDKVLLLALGVHFLFLGTLWGLYLKESATRIKVTVYDVLAKPGAKLELSAKFERDGALNRDLEKIEVRLSLQV